MTKCGLNDGSYTGACESCGQRLDCMLTEIMRKLQKLEATIPQKHLEA